MKYGTTLSLGGGTTAAASWQCHMPTRVEDRLFAADRVLHHMP